MSTSSKRKCASILLRILFVLFIQFFTRTIGTDPLDLVEKIPPKLYPSIVSIGIAYLHPEIYLTGVLIHPKWAILSAHCVWKIHHSPGAKRFFIKAGSVDLGSKNKNHVQKRFVDRVIFHHFYAPNSSDYDLVLMATKKPFNVGTEYLELARFFEIPYPNTTQECKVLGFDMMSSFVVQGGEQLGKLKGNDMETGNTDFCYSFRNETLDSQYLCARFIDEEVECHVDFGRVLFCNGILAGFSVTGCDKKSAFWDENCEDKSRGYLLFVFVGGEFGWAKEYIADLEFPVPFVVRKGGRDYDTIVRADTTNVSRHRRRSDAQRLTRPNTSCVLLAMAICMGHVLW